MAQDPPTDPGAQHAHDEPRPLADANLRRARRHATALERLAAVIASAAIAVAAFLVAGDPSLLGPAVLGATGAVVLWAVLRALALLLHLRVDQASAQTPGGSRRVPTAG